MKARPLDGWAFVPVLFCSPGIVTRNLPRRMDNFLIKATPLGSALTCFRAVNTRLVDGIRRWAKGEQCQVFSGRNMERLELHISPGSGLP